MNITVVRRRYWGASLMVLLLAIGIMGVACKRSSDAPPDQQVASQPAAVYACPMHPQIRESKPGKCPICGMELVQTKQPGPNTGK